MPAQGLHLLADLHRCACARTLMCEPDTLAALCRRRVAEAGLTAVGEVFHHFGPGCGVTGVVVLAESHLAVHTWPEDGYVSLDVFVCNRSRDNRTRAEHLFAALLSDFAPAEPRLQRIARD